MDPLSKVLLSLSLRPHGAVAPQRNVYLEKTTHERKNDLQVEPADGTVAEGDDLVHRLFLRGKVCNSGCSSSRLGPYYNPQ